MSLKLHFCGKKVVPPIPVLEFEEIGKAPGPELVARGADEIFDRRPFFTPAVQQRFGYSAIGPDQRRLTPARGHEAKLALGCAH